MITPISDKDDIVIPATMHIWGFCFSGKMFAEAVTLNK
jgi:hypothetical protein